MLTDSPYPSQSKQLTLDNPQDPISQRLEHLDEGVRGLTSTG